MKNIHYDFLQLDLYSLPNLKRNELVNIIALFHFLYFKQNLHPDNPEVNFKYSDIPCMSDETVKKTIDVALSLNLFSLIKRPTKHLPVTIKLHTNELLQKILHRNNTINLEKYQDPIKKDDLKDFLKCSNLNNHFDNKKVKTWLRNVQNGVWDKNSLFIISKVVSNFNSDDINMKTASINKYMAKKDLTRSLDILFNRLPNNKKELLYNEFSNAVQTKTNKKIAGKFSDIVKIYVESISKIEKADQII